MSATPPRLRRARRLAPHHHRQDERLLPVSEIRGHLEEVGAHGGLTIPLEGSGFKAGGVSARWGLTDDRNNAIVCLRRGNLPRTEVVFYAESDGTCPLLEWLDRLPQKVQDKCIVRIERLNELGHELRRPEADLLRDGIHELRASHQGVHYRILYFFHAGTAVLAHAIVKESQVPDIEIRRAKRRKDAYEANPERHTYHEP